MDKKIHKEAQQKAKRVKKGSEQKAATGYLNSAMKNQRKAAEDLGKALKSYDSTVKNIITNADSKDVPGITEVVTKVNKLLAQAKKGDNIDKIVAQLKALK